MTYCQKPSIFQLGKVHENGPSVIVSGWGLGMCVSSCRCHRNPDDGQLALAEDQAGGKLGLRSFTATGELPATTACPAAFSGTVTLRRSPGEALNSALP